MPPQISELESLLRQMIAEHRQLLSHVEAHEAAVKTLDLAAMDDAGRKQEAARMRIASMEQRRRVLSQQLARAMNVAGEVTIRKIAAVYPLKAQSLLQLRVELKGLIEQISARCHVAGKVAAAVLGHLNTVVRLVSGVVERAGLYSKKGVPRMSSRIGMMDAVG